MFSVIRADAVRGALPFSAVTADGFQGATPFSPTFQWPQTNAHTAMAQRFIDMIPRNASVSAQSHLVPHISQRTNIYLFPYADDRADYIFLDVSGNTYPLLSFPYIQEVKKVLLNGGYGIVAAEDGYLLLKHGLPSVGVSRNSPYGIEDNSDTTDLLPNLPAEFCSFTQVAPQQVQNPLQATFSSNDASATSIHLVGMHLLAPEVFSLSNATMQITTYWKVDAPISTPLRFLVDVADKDDNDHFATIDFPALAWCPTNTWQSGAVLSVISDLFLLRGIPNGLAHVSLALLPITHPFSTIMDDQSWYTLQVENAPGGVVASHGTKALQVATVSIVP